MWSFLKHYDGAQPGKRKTASSTPSENVREKRTKYEQGFYIKNVGSAKIQRVQQKFSGYHVFLFY
jgi:hypothetical protein